MVEPADPPQGCQLNGFLGESQGRTAVNEFGVVQAVDCRGQCVVVAVAMAANRGLDASFGQAFTIADGHILRPSRSDGSENRHCRPVGVDIDDKGHVQPALPGRCRCLLLQLAIKLRLREKGAGRVQDIASPAHFANLLLKRLSARAHWW